MMRHPRQGSCLCGAVRVKAAPKADVGACHCKQCRRWGGAPLMTVECADDVQFDGAEHITVFESSKWAERGFCNRCGSHLFWRLKQGGPHEVPVGLFDDDAEWVFATQVFIDEKPAFYAFANETTELTGAEVFAKFMPKD